MLSEDGLCSLGEIQLCFARSKHHKPNPALPQRSESPQLLLGVPTGFSIAVQPSLTLVPTVSAVSVSAVACPACALPGAALPMSGGSAPAREHLNSSYHSGVRWRAAQVTTPGYGAVTTPGYGPSYHSGVRTKNVLSFTCNRWMLPNNTGGQHPPSQRYRPQWCSTSPVFRWRLVKSFPQEVFDRMVSCSPSPSVTHPKL